MWALVSGAHTGILTTLRSSGAPASVPVWFVVSDRTIYVRTPARTRKVANIRRDPRVCFLVESGLAWVELTAALIHGEARLVDDPALCERIDAAFDAKYEGYRTPSTVPEATRRHYAAPRAHIAVEAVGRPLTWDNAKLRLGA